MAGTPSTKVWIGDLPEGFDESSAQTIFGAYGEIKWSKIMQGKGGKITALIEFAGLDEAQWFVENLNGNIPEGLTTPIETRFYSGGKAKGKDGNAGKDAGYGGKDYGGKAYGGKDYGGKAYGGKDFGGKDAGKSGYGGYGSYGKADGGKNGKGSYGGYGKADGGKSGKNGTYGSPYGGGKSGKGGGGKGKMKSLLKAAVTGGVVIEGDRPDENCAAFTGLPQDCTHRDLYELCSPFGAIVPQGIILKKVDRECTGVGFCDFVDSSSVESIIAALNGHEGLGITHKDASMDKGQDA